MSDVMLFGVLRMPFELAMADDLSRVQFYGRAVEAADRIERLEAELARLRVSQYPPPRDATPSFERWAADPVRAEKLPLVKHGNGAYKDARSYAAFYGWQGYACQVQAIFQKPEGIDPFADIGTAATTASYERLRLACCIQQPAPVPDQMALVWRADLMRMRHELMHKQAFFDLRAGPRDTAHVTPAVADTMDHAQLGALGRQQQGNTA